MMLYYMLCMIATKVMYNIIIYCFFFFLFLLWVFPFPFSGFARSGLIRPAFLVYPPQIYAQIRLFCAKFGYYMKFFLIPFVYIKLIMYFYTVNKTLKHAARVDKYGALRV